MVRTESAALCGVQSSVSYAITLDSFLKRSPSPLEVLLCSCCHSCPCDMHPNGLGPAVLGGLFQQERLWFCESLGVFFLLTGLRGQSKCSPYNDDWSNRGGSIKTRTWQRKSLSQWERGISEKKSVLVKEFGFCAPCSVSCLLGTLPAAGFQWRSSAEQGRMWGVHCVRTSVARASHRNGESWFLLYWLSILCWNLSLERWGRSVNPVRCPVFVFPS